MIFFPFIGKMYYVKVKGVHAYYAETLTTGCQWRIQVRPTETPVYDFAILGTLIGISSNGGAYTSHWILTSARVVFAIGNQFGWINDTITRFERGVLVIHQMAFINTGSGGIVWETNCFLWRWCTVSGELIVILPISIIVST